MTATPVVPFHRIINNTHYGERSTTVSDDGAPDSFWFDLGAPVEAPEPPAAPAETYAPLNAGAAPDPAAAAEADALVFRGEADADLF